MARASLVSLIRPTLLRWHRNHPVRAFHLPAVRGGQVVPAGHSRWGYYWFPASSSSLIRSRARSSLCRTIESRRRAISAPRNEAGGSYAIRSSISTPRATFLKVNPPSCLIGPDSEIHPISYGRRQRFSLSTLLIGTPR